MVCPDFSRRRITEHYHLGIFRSRLIPFCMGSNQYQLLEGAGLPEQETDELNLIALPLEVGYLYPHKVFEVIHGWLCAQLIDNSHDVIRSDFWELGAQITNAIIQRQRREYEQVHK